MLLLLGSILYVPYAVAETIFDYGAAFRLRQEIWDDVVTLGTSNTGSAADRNFFRLRTQLWGSADFSGKADVFMRLVNEAKYFDGPFTAYKANNVSTGPDRLDSDELIIDNLYFDAKDIFRSPCRYKDRASGLSRTQYVW